MISILIVLVEPKTPAWSTRVVTDGNFITGQNPICAHAAAKAEPQQRKVLA